MKDNFAERRPKKEEKKKKEAMSRRSVDVSEANQRRENDESLFFGRQQDEENLRWRLKWVRLWGGGVRKWLVADFFFFFLQK